MQYVRLRPPTGPRYDCTARCGAIEVTAILLLMLHLRLGCIPAHQRVRDRARVLHVARALVPEEFAFAQEEHAVRSVHKQSQQ